MNYIEIIQSRVHEIRAALHGPIPTLPKFKLCISYGEIVSGRVMYARASAILLIDYDISHARLVIIVDNDVSAVSPHVFVLPLCRGYLLQFA